MLSLSLPGRVFLCTLPTDMRKSFDSLSGLVEQQLGLDPLSGDLFVFRSKRGDRLKLLFWDEDGLLLYYKRLEIGSFVLPPADATRTRAGAHGLVLKPAELAMLLAGIDLSAKRHHRYQRPQATAVPQTAAPSSSTPSSQ
jgi:transposase